MFATQHIPVHMHPSAGTYPVLNWIIAYELIQVGLLTSVCASSLKSDEIVRGLMDDNFVLEFLNHTLQKQIGCFNHRVVTLVAVQLWL